MAVNWLQNRLIPNNELLDPVLLIFRSVVFEHTIDYTYRYPYPWYKTSFRCALRENHYYYTFYQIARFFKNRGVLYSRNTNLRSWLDIKDGFYTFSTASDINFFCFLRRLKHERCTVRKYNILGGSNTLVWNSRR